MVGQEVRLGAGVAEIQRGRVLAKRILTKSVSSRGRRDTAVPATVK